MSTNPTGHHSSHAVHSHHHAHHAQATQPAPSPSPSQSSACQAPAAPGDSVPSQVEDDGGDGNNPLQNLLNALASSNEPASQHKHKHHHHCHSGGGSAAPGGGRAPGGGMPGGGSGLPGGGGFPGGGGAPGGGFPAFPGLSGGGIPSGAAMPFTGGAGMPSSGGLSPLGASQQSAPTSGTSGSPDPQTLLNNVRTVVQVAHQKGVDPVTAVATMLTESQGNNQAVGDNGSSFGLFQLHRGGELGSMSPQQAFNPTTNANTALSQFAQVQKSRGLTGGVLAAAAQRPANPGQYAQKVNNNMQRARQLMQEAGVS